MKLPEKLKAPVTTLSSGTAKPSIQASVCATPRFATSEPSMQQVAPPVKLAALEPSTRHTGWKPVPPTLFPGQARGLSHQLWADFWTR